MRLLLLLAALPLLAADPWIFYSKKFPGSKPEYMEVRLKKDGTAEYRETPDEDPLTFRLATQEAETMFLLAAKLDHFKRPLESGLNVARMGDKTFRWETGGPKQEVVFNYSQDLDAQALQDWFEKICESAYLYYNLERTVKYDRMGTYQAILKLEAAWDRQRIVSAEQYIPLLTRVVKNDVYLNMARERAEKLIAVFKAGPPKPQENGEKTPK